MNLARIFRVTALTMATVAFTPPAADGAEPKFPAKPMRFVLGSSPGATADILARMIGAKMSENWGQPVVFETRTGASGMLAANVVAKAAPDGYTLLLTSPSFAIRAALVPNQPFDSLKDFSGVAEIGTSNTVLLVAPAKGVKAAKELIALAKVQPGRILFSSGGAGTADHMNSERFNHAAGIKTQHVGFKGQSEALIEVVAGRVHYTVASLTSSMTFVKDGRLLALAVAYKTPQLPAVPEMSEAVTGWSRNGTHAIYAPARTPLAIRQQVSREVARILNLPDIREKLDAVSFSIAPTSPEEHERNLRNDIAVFAKVGRESGLKPN